MEIIPHEPVNNYEVDGFPLSSIEAFIVYVNGVQICSLKTTNKTIVGAINELWDMIQNLDLSDYVKQDAFKALQKVVEGIEDDITDIRGDIVDIRADITRIDKTLDNHETRIKDLETAIGDKLPNAPLNVVNVTFTDPRYFDNGEKMATTSDNFLTVSANGQVLQSIQLEDGIIELLNVNLNRNQDVDFDRTPKHFYVPMAIDHFDSSGNFQKRETVMIDAEWTVEMGSYDVSFYFRGTIEDVNQYTKFHLTSMIPYFVERS